MEMRLESVTGQTRVVRRRAFTKWVNFHLSQRSLSIDDLIDLSDCFVTIKLLEILSQRKVPIRYSGQQPIRIKQRDCWTKIFEFLRSQDFPSVIDEEDLDSLSRGSVDILLAFVWFLIEVYLIEPCRTTMLGKTQSSARKFILSWVQQKLPGRNINNFDEDWKDGVAICELVNALQPDAIPSNLYSDKTNCEGNVKLGIQVAHDKFGIPQIISPFDIATSHIDELSILTYIALFCKYESLIKGDTNNNKATSSSHRENSVCKAYGSGLKSGEIGKVAEFIVELQGAKASDITIAIECKPTYGGYDEKPELSVKSVGRSTYVVKYIPTKPGEYIISVLHCGAHILRSPFHLSVTGPAGQNGIIDEMNGSVTKNSKTGSLESIPGIRETLRDTALPVFKSMKEAPNHDKTDSGSSNHANGAQSLNSSTPVVQVRDLSLEIPMNTAEGPGLVAGEVGRVGKFTVITDNNTKGPLSVCISCPAVSIPVPYVKSEKKSTHTEHRVLYIPTEPGTYEIFIKWGENGIRGSPFKVFINDVNLDELSAAGDADPEDLGGRGKIRVYYAATSMKPRAQRDKQLLETFLRGKHISNRPDFDSWIALDVGMSRAQREKVFKKAGHRSTPMLFVNDRYIGTYEDVVIMDKEGLFDSCLEY
ncbi:filamin-A-like [Actinia tenebrosa]|uniref:Filamin-A-like n=1 Tax=Actinia tenebrosa TaxID=6105 RepID=A0A6P8GZS0_ACTTE|nr:filamin-A-like [Actinia tenebrosa]